VYVNYPLCGKFHAFHEVPFHYLTVVVWSAVGTKRIIGPNTHIGHTATPFLKHGWFRENLCLLHQKSTTAHTA
jgi:hypothetical protein